MSESQQVISVSETSSNDVYDLIQVGGRTKKSNKKQETVKSNNDIKKKVKKVKNTESSTPASTPVSEKVSKKSIDSTLVLPIKKLPNDIYNIFKDFQQYIELQKTVDTGSEAVSVFFEMVEEFQNKNEITSEDLARISSQTKICSIFVKNIFGNQNKKNEKTTTDVIAGVIKDKFNSLVSTFIRQNEPILKSLGLSFVDYTKTDSANTESIKTFKEVSGFKFPAYIPTNDQDELDDQQTELKIHTITEFYNHIHYYFIKPQIDSRNCSQELKEKMNSLFEIKNRAIVYFYMIMVCHLFLNYMCGMNKNFNELDEKERAVAKKINLILINFFKLLIGVTDKKKPLLKNSVFKKPQLKDVSSEQKAEEEDAE